MSDEPSLDEELLVVSDLADENGYSRAAKYIRDLVEAERRAQEEKTREDFWREMYARRQARIREAYRHVSTTETIRRTSPYLRRVPPNGPGHLEEIPHERYEPLLERFDQENAARPRLSVWQRFKRSTLSALGVDQ